MQKVLVTGGAGYIGAHACKALAQAGYVPVAYDDLSRGHRDSVRWGPLEEGDLLDGQRLRAAIARHRPSAVLHFAALIQVGESVAQPARYWRANLLGSLGLFEAAAELGVPRVIFSSTAAVYGQPSTIPVAESHPLGPLNPYGNSKAAAEAALRDMAAAFPLQYAVLRYFNASGADPDGEIGERREPKAHLVPIALEAALGRRSEVVIYGADWDTPDGSGVRDYVHVSDLARAHVLALRYLEGGGPSGTWNLGCAQGHSVLEVLAACERVTGRPIPRRVGPRREGDPGQLYADSSRATRDFGWVPQWPDLDSMAEHTWRWMTRGAGA